ncbi:hypothetical protein RJ639_045902, partial [Escallonia herrerae]
VIAKKPHHFYWYCPLAIKEDLLIERKFIAVCELSFLLALLCCCNALESPSYMVVHSKADLEIRLYRELLWMSGLVRGATSFKKSTEGGFQSSPFSRNLGCSAFASTLYEYIPGANEISFRLMITAPILTTMAQVARGSDYIVLEKHEGSLPQRYAELNSHLDKRKKLLSSLDKILDGKNAVLGDKSYYGVAQYNASSHLSG